MDPSADLSRRLQESILDRALELLRLARYPGLRFLDFVMELRARGFGRFSVLLQRVQGDTQFRACCAGLLHNKTQAAIQFLLRGGDVSLSNAGGGLLHLFGDLRYGLLNGFFRV